MDINYLKQENESEFEYGLRLIKIKMEDKPDLEWADMVELLDLGVHYDSLRKSCQGKFGGYEVAQYYENKILDMMKESSDKADKNQQIELENLIKTLEEKKIAIQSERIKLSSLRSDLNKSVREQARMEQWIEEIKIAAKEVMVDIPNLKRIEEISDEDKEYLLTIADVHTGKKGESLDNYYDLDKLQSRMWQIRDEVIALIKEKNIKTLKILSLGDLIDGLLRCSQLQNLQIMRPAQTVFVVRFLSEWLTSITELGNCNVDFYMTTSSNHSEGRPIGTQHGEFKNDDYEIIIYEWLCDLCSRNPRIKITGSPILDFEILGRQCVALHGHQLKSALGKNMLANVSFKLHKQFQYMFVGHLHHTEIKTVGKNELGNQEILYCPCICGNDEYSDSLWTGASAGSLFIEFNKKQGRRCVTDIIVD